MTTNDTRTYTIHTEVGDIRIQIDLRRAPGTCANFMRYVDAGLFTGGRFHRTVRLDEDQYPNNAVPIEVIQAGIDPAREGDKFEAIALERTRDTGLKHVDGAVSMARFLADSATADFFICVGDQPQLDFGGKRNPDGQGFAAFGRVTGGMDVVQRIHDAPHDVQKLAPPIRILAIKPTAD